MHKLSRKAAHQDWREPPHQNKHQRYIFRDSQDVVALVQKYFPLGSAKILELGCNVGTSLEALRAAGYHNLTGIEINPRAVEAMQELHADTAAIATILVGPIEEYVKTLGRYDLIFSKATLCHLHPMSEWVFADLAKLTKLIITLEDEQTDKSQRHWARNYRRALAPFGFRQVEYIHQPEGLNGAYVGRVLQR